MSVMVNGQEFFTATEVAEDVGVVRQTLWRWRQQGKIPAGYRYRGRQILYSENELEGIREFAHKLEPLTKDENPSQQRLF